MLNAYDMMVLNAYDMMVLNAYDMVVLNAYDMVVLNAYDMMVSPIIKWELLWTTVIIINDIYHGVSCITSII